MRPWPDAHDDVAVVGEPVEHGGGHFGVAEHLGPIGEGEVCGDEQGGVLVELADQMKQELSARLAERQIWLSDRPLDANDGAEGDALLRVIFPNPMGGIEQYEWRDESGFANQDIPAVGPARNLRGLSRTMWRQQARRRIDKEAAFSRIPSALKRTFRIVMMRCTISFLGWG